MAANKVTVKVGTQFDKSGTQAAKKEISEVGGKGQSSAKAFMGAWASATVVVAGVIKTIKAAKAKIDETTEAAKEQWQVEQKRNAVIRSTGNVINATASQLNAYATELADATAIGDELIINMQAQMATFKQIGGDIFPEAIERAADLAKVMDKDLNSSVQMVGKALNDPIQGINAMARAGVQFTDQQKDMIKGFVETNQLSKAQGIIMTELESQFGGAARAMAHSTDLYKNAVGDMKESIGQGFEKWLEPGRIAMTKWMNENREKIRGVIENFPEIVALAGSTAKKILTKAFEWENFKEIVKRLGIGIFTVIKTSIMEAPMLFLRAMQLSQTPIVNFTVWLDEIFNSLWAKVHNGFILWMQDLPVLDHFFKDAQLLPENEVRSFGQVWDQTVNQIKTGGAQLVTDYIGYLGEQVSNIAGAGASIGELFTDEVNAFKSSLNDLMVPSQVIEDDLGQAADNAGDLAENVEQAGSALRRITGRNLLAELFDKAKAKIEETKLAMSGLNSVEQQIIAAQATGNYAWLEQLRMVKTELEGILGVKKDISKTKVSEKSETSSLFEGEKVTAESAWEKAKGIGEAALNWIFGIIQKSKLITDALESAERTVSRLFDTVLPKLGPGIMSVLKVIEDLTKNSGPDLADIFTMISGTLLVFKPLLDATSSLFSEFFGIAKSVLPLAISLFTTQVNRFLPTIKVLSSILGFVGHILEGLAVPIEYATKGFDVFGRALHSVTTLLEWVAKNLKSTGEVISLAMQLKFDKIKNVQFHSFGDLGNMFADIWNQPWTYDQLTSGAEGNDYTLSEAPQIHGGNTTVQRAAPKYFYIDLNGPVFGGTQKEVGEALVAALKNFFAAGGDNPFVEAT